MWGGYLTISQKVLTLTPGRQFQTELITFFAIYFRGPYSCRFGSVIATKLGKSSLCISCILTYMSPMRYKTSIGIA